MISRGDASNKNNDNDGSLRLQKTSESLQTAKKSVTNLQVEICLGNQNREHKVKMISTNSEDNRL